MGKNQRARRAASASAQLPLWVQIAAPIVYFFAVCLASASTAKAAGMALLLLTLLLVFPRLSTLRERCSAPLLALALVVVMDGLSTLYSVSGKFALSEFLKVVCAFCLTVVLLAAVPGEGVQPGRRIASILAGFSALAGLVSIDLISTRFVSGLVLSLLSLLTPDYLNLGGLEAGVRMTSVFSNPNIFAGVAGLGTLLSLGLVLSSPSRRERRVHTVCLYMSALSFLLAFSMGASAMIALAFLSYLILERKERRGALLILMVETLLLTVASAALVSLSSLDPWTGPRPVPLLCALLGAAALCAADSLLGQKLAQRLDRHSRGALFLTAGVIAAAAVFVLLALRLTGPAQLQGGEGLRRAAYPEPGAYTLSVRADAPLNVRVESQNQQQTMMHTNTVLYQGEADGAAFTVPEDSLVVYFNFSSGQAVRIEGADYRGEKGSGSIPLHYRLLPGFIANRLQGLLANQNAIQRVVFFADGLKLFRRSPVAGLGLGAFENGIMSVQTFFYETKYAHNHYIQALAETGIIGLLLFLSLLAVSAIAVWRTLRKEDAHPLVPALGAALVFMAGHAGVEVIFSSYPYLPIAFGTFALIGLCCPGAFPVPKKVQTVRTAAILGACALLAAFGVLLGMNMYAYHMVTQAATLGSLSFAARIDKYEWADYMLSYVIGTMDPDTDGAVREQADRYAARLAQVDSNTIPIYLTEYYLRTGRPQLGLEMAEKYVDYTSSNAETWQEAFDLLEIFEEDTDLYRAGVVRIAGMLEAWNAENMGSIQLSEESMAFIARMGG